MSTPGSAAQAYLPNRVLGYLADDGRPVALPGAILLADLEDFTGLTEALAASAGADFGEVVCQGLNQVLGPAAEAIAAQGGEVIKLSGDGLMGLFVGDGAALAAAVRSAAGVTDREAVSPSGKVHRFRCAIAHGGVLLAGIGGHGGRREVVAGGPAVHAAERLLAGSQPGQAARVEQLEGRLPAVPPPSPPPPPDGAAQRFLPPYLRDRLAGPRLQWLQEFRTLTLLFASIRPQAELDGLSAAANTLQAVVAGQGGELLGLSLEGGQLVAQVAFGLMVDGAMVGAREALDCALLLAQGPHAASAGVSTGRVMLGPIGSDTRRQLTTLGQGVIMAARLMQQAQPAQALCDEATWAAAAGRFDGQRRQAVLKGLGLRAHWQLLRSAQWPASGVSDEVPTGRAAEAAQVAAELGRPDGRPRPIVVVGEPGIGKSRFGQWLVAELGRHAVASVWRVAATPIDRHTPFGALAPVLRQLCGVADTGDAALALQATAQAVLGDAARAPLLADALRLPMADSATTAPLTGPVRADNIRDALVAVAQAHLRQDAAALVIDDAHWLDASSWQLLQRLAGDVTGLRLVILSRPTGDAAPHAPLALAATAVLQLTLQPLGDADIRAIALRRMDAGAQPEVPEVLWRWLTERARGNPLFAQELGSSLRQAVLAGPGAARLREAGDQARLSALPLSPTIESLLQHRIEHIGVEDGTALKVASVLGGSFALDVLAELMAAVAHHDDPRQCLDRLVAAELAVAVGPGRFAFAHRLTQEAAYRMLSGERRRALHRAAAGVLQRGYGKHAAEHAAELAYHAMGANDTAQAIGWLDLAGAQALRGGANMEASTHFRQLLELGADQERDRRAAWRRQLAQALFGLGQVDEVAVQARQAIELVRPALPARPWGWTALAARLVLRRVMRRVMRGALPAAWPPAGRDDADEAWIEAARAAGLLAETAYFANAPEMMLGSALLAVELAEQARRTAPVSVAHGMLAVVAGMVRLHGVARRHLDHAHHLARTAADPLQQGVAWFYEGMVHGCRGDWPASGEAELRALSFTEPLGAHVQSGFQYTLLATNALYTSDYARSRAWMKTVAERAERTANPQQQGWSLNVVAVADLHQGRLDQAAHGASQARRIFLRERDGISLIISDGVLCAALSRAGCTAQALACADQASQLLAHARPTTWGQLEGFAGPCEAYAQAAILGHLDARQAWARAAEPLRCLRLFQQVFPFGRARYRWICALFAQARGRRGAARRALLHAMALARRHGLPFEEWHAATLLARLDHGAPAPLAADRQSWLERRMRFAGETDPA